MLPIELWSKVANNLLETDCLNLFVILIHTNTLGVEQVKLLKKWYNLFNMPFAYKAMLSVYRNIEKINSKKLYISYFNKVNNTLFRGIILSEETRQDICKKRLNLSKVIEDEKHKKKFLNLTKKLVPISY
tara:strand:- start:1059 stop:1448 length:390 start_codon:yes stop_codon:yes gene_type:complete